MKYKNTVEMWHKIGEFADFLVQFSKFNEQLLSHECIYYDFDSQASEEECCNFTIKREKDFNSSEECWKCSFYTTLPDSEHKAKENPRTEKKGKKK